MFYTDDFMYDVMGIEELPNTLYHYTSIETLALILSNRTLRFSRLDGVNDPEEATASDLPNASTLVFASCWTAQQRESLPMWSMYTKDLAGVRISLPSNPFSGRDMPTVFEKGGARQIIDGRVTVTRERGGMDAHTSMIFGPNKIYYTDEPSYRNGSCLVNDGFSLAVQLHDLGMVKNTHWAFEEEWRFKILAAPSEIDVRETSPASHPAYDLINFPVRENAVFAPLDAECLKAVEIMLGPCVSREQEAEVQMLIAAHAPSATVRRSAINVRGKS
jgi:hypothetical protein